MTGSMPSLPPWEHLDSPAAVRDVLPALVAAVTAPPAHDTELRAAEASLALSWLVRRGILPWDDAALLPLAEAWGPRLGLDPTRRPWVEGPEVALVLAALHQARLPMLRHALVARLAASPEPAAAGALVRALELLPAALAEEVLVREHELLASARDARVRGLVERGAEHRQRA